MNERDYAHRVREAVQFCKNEHNIIHASDYMMGKADRMVMEQCLTKNYLIAKGMDYFGKKDLIYLDMMGTSDVEALRTKEYKP